MRISRALAGGVAIAAFAGLAACSTGPADPGDRSISIGVPGWQLGATWEPGAGPGLWFIGNHPVYESLITWDLDRGDFVGELAESFELSDDGTVLSLKLREDVDFTDGEHLDADAVVTALTDLFTREGSGWEYFGTDVVPVATGEYDVELTFAVPVYDVFSDKLTELTHMPIASPAALADRSVFEDGPVGTGPYLLEEIIPEVSVTFVRNPEYRDPEAYDFDTVVLKVFDDRIAALNALKSGQLDAAEADASLAAEAEGAGHVVHTGPMGFATIDFSRSLELSPEATALVPETQDVRVRQAINLALDRAAIVEQIDGGLGRVSSQPLDPDTIEYVDGGDARYPYDPERAGALLAEAGYPDGFTLRLPLTARSAGEVARYSPYLEQALGDIGVTVEWVDLQGGDLLAALTNGDIHADYWQGFYPNVVRDAAAWILRHGEAAGDEAIVEAAEHYTSGSLAEHAASQPVLAEYALDMAFFAPIAHPLQFWVTTPGIDLRLSNLPDYFVKLKNFSVAD